MPVNPLRTIFRRHAPSVLALCLTGWLVLVQAGEKPPLEARLVPAGETFAAAKDVQFTLRFEDQPNLEPIRTAEWEIRDAGETRRVARFPYRWNLGGTNLPDKRLGRTGQWADGFSSDDVRQIGDLPPGEYHLAFLLNGIRASNVVTLRLDPKFDPLTAPTFTIGALEPFPSGHVTEPILWTIGPTPADKQISNISLYGAKIEVDGAEHSRSMLIWTGPVALIRDGARHGLTLDLSQYQPAVEPNKPHTYGFKLAGRSATPVRVDPTDYHLGENWDHATASLAPAPVPKPLVAGKVMTVKGQPAAGSELWLRTRSRTVATEYADAEGHYAFPGIPPGRYRLLSKPGPKSSVAAERVVVLAADQTLTLDLKPEEDKKPTPWPKPTPLPASLRYIDLAKVEATLGQGLSVNERAQDGNTPLAIAAMCGKLDLVKRLVEAGAEINSPIDGNTTVFSRALSDSHLDVAEYLISQGAKINEPYPNGRETPLTSAAARGSIPLTRLLLEHGADAKWQNPEGESALTRAAARGQAEVVQLLLQHGADANQADPDGVTPLMHAARSGDPSTVKALLQNGADVHAADLDGNTALFFASETQAKSRDYAGVLQALLDKGARPNQPTALGMTPLTAAVKNGMADRVKILVVGGANLQGEDGEKALWNAIRSRQCETLTTLLQLGANPNADLDHGYSALFLAIGSQDEKAVEILLAHKANPNATKLEPGNEVTALMSAATTGNTAIIDQLLKAGAKADTKDDQGRTALDYARNAQKSDAIKRLSEL